MMYTMYMHDRGSLLRVQIVIMMLSTSRSRTNAISCTMFQCTCVFHTVYKTILHMLFSALVPGKDRRMWSKHRTIAIYCTYSAQHHYTQSNILSNNFAFNKVFSHPKLAYTRPSLHAEGGDCCVPSSPAITRCWSHLGHKHPKQLAEPLVQVETTALGQLNGLCQTDALLLLSLCSEGV